MSVEAAEPQEFWSDPVWTDRPQMPYEREPVELEPHRCQCGHTTRVCRRTPCDMGD